jgi:carboxymethylenebutenolidase
MERKKASDYPQEILDLFHEYQHGHMSRRDFIDRLGKYATAGVTAVAIYESLKPNYAWAQQVKPEDSRIRATRETVPSPNGNGSISGYFVRPANASGKLPAIIVIHENRGLNPYIEDVARRFALEGYVAYAPDGLTSVGGYPGDDEKGAAKFREVNGPKMFEDFVNAANWLRTNPACNGKLGAIGFCFGGGIVNQLAVRLGSDLAAGAPFYGRQPSAEDTAKIKAPLMLHYADPAKDPGVGNGIAGFEEALKANGKTYQKFIYEGANHGFHNDTTPRYDEAAAKLAWTRTLAFFNQYVKGSKS